MVDVMPTVLALAGATGSPDHPFDGKNIWPTLAANQASSHEDVLINVEAFRGAIRKGNWKLVKIALLPGKTELFDLSKDAGEKNNVADQFPEIVRDLEARLLAYARVMKPSEWIKSQPAFLGAQGKTIFDPDFDIDDSGLPHEKPALPKRASIIGSARVHRHRRSASRQSMVELRRMSQQMARTHRPSYRSGWSGSWG